MSDACMFNSPKQYLTEGKATYLLMIVFRHMCHVWKGYGCVWYVVVQKRRLRRRGEVLVVIRMEGRSACKSVL